MENRTGSWKNVGTSIITLSRKYSTPVGAATLYVTVALLILLAANANLAHVSFFFLTQNYFFSYGDDDFDNSLASSFFFFFLIEKSLFNNGLALQSKR